MRSAVTQVMPTVVRRGLVKFGADLSLARRKRRLTAQMLAERIGVSKTTYLKMEKGDPATAVGAYAMALFVLGFGTVFGELIDQRRDDQGLLFDAARVPRRVRVHQDPRSS